MKKLFILLGLLMFSILGCSCERIKVPEETRVLGGCVYVEKKEFRECSQPEMPAHNYVGFIFDKKEYDADEVLVTVYFGINEDEFRRDYDGVYEQFTNRHNRPEWSQIEIKKIVDFNIYVYFHAFNDKGSIEENQVLELKNKMFLIDKIKFTDLETFPFEDYSFNEVQIEDERYQYQYIYKKNYQVKIPKEMFEYEEGKIALNVSEIAYFEDGSKHGTGPVFCQMNQRFFYKKEGNKVIIWN